MYKRVGGTIYGIEKDNKLFYIGKTNRKLVRNKNSKKESNELTISDATYQYANPELRKVIESNSTKIVPLKDVDADEWYDEKLLEVVNHHKHNHPLMNSQWMLDGGRGYWQNKTRDANTLKKLSESKYHKFIEYDINGELKKIWSSGKEAAIKVFKDYTVVDGGGSSRLYRVCRCQSIRNRFYHNSYWLKETELIKFFGLIPKKINISAIINEEKRKKRIAYNNRAVKLNGRRNLQTISRYSVERLDDKMNVIEIYLNIDEAGFKLKIYPRTVKRLCTSGCVKNSKYNLRYGSKIKQPFDVTYPKYEILPHIIPGNSEYVKTRTYKTVVEYNELGKIINTYDNVFIASEKLNIIPVNIRFICTNHPNFRDDKKYPILRYGEKKKVKLN
jgi:hypothetical protein